MDYYPVQSKVKYEFEKKKYFIQNNLFATEVVTINNDLKVFFSRTIIKDEANGTVIDVSRLIKLRIEL